MGRIDLWVRKHRLLLFLSVFYFLLRLYHLTAIPIFNDEAIYLDWGWRETHHLNFLFYSLYDSKPPLLMWIFGLASVVFSSSLVAGRFVSVCAGYLTLLGVWKLAKKVSNELTAVIASLLYIAIPFFSFFDRQALMESAVGAVGVWACYAFLRSLELKASRWPMAVGVIIGIGYFVKTSALIFLFPCIVLTGYYLLVSAKKRSYYLVLLFLIGSLFLLIITPLLVQPMFWKTLGSNNRYMISPVELFSTQLGHWIASVRNAAVILLVHMTPPVVLFLLFSIVGVFRNRSRNMKIITIWFLLTCLVSVVFIRSIIERYLVSVLPPAVILVSYFFQELKNRTVRISMASLTITAALSVTVLQITSPLRYFSFLSHVSSFALKEYTSGYTSGYGIDEVIVFLEKKIGENPAFVTVGLHTGNPESAVIIYFDKKKNVQTTYLDASQYPNLNSFQCISSSIPLYFVSRETDQVGLERFLEQNYYKKNPVSGFGIGIYTLKKPCTGPTMELSAAIE